MGDFRGDLRKLGSLLARLDDLSRIPSRAARVIADDLDGLIQDQFDRGVSPYGNPWAKLAEATLAKGRFPPPLTDTRNMRDGITVSLERGAGISIVFPSGPAGFHQGGTVNMPARPILPSGSALPREWSRVITVRISEAFGGKR